MLHIQDEHDLHVSVVKYIRDNYPFALLVPGLGEFQSTRDLRLEGWHKGYTSGQPDLLILHPSRDNQYVGFAFEFKHPCGTSLPTKKQVKFLEDLNSVGFKTMVSHSFADIVTELAAYFWKPSQL